MRRLARSQGLEPAVARASLSQGQVRSGVVVQVDNQLPIVLNRESSFIRGIPGMGVLSGFMESW